MLDQPGNGNTDASSGLGPGPRGLGRLWPSRRVMRSSGWQPAQTPQSVCGGGSAKVLSSMFQPRLRARAGRSEQCGTEVLVTSPARGRHARGVLCCQQVRVVWCRPDTQSTRMQGTIHPRVRTLSTHKHSLHESMHARRRLGTGATWALLHALWPAQTFVRSANAGPGLAAEALALPAAMRASASSAPVGTPAAAAKRFGSMVTLLVTSWVL